jgi:radical SAM enzyme (TIGR01210 family)
VTPAQSSSHLRPSAREVRRLRGPRAKVDPFRPLGTVVERERWPEGGARTVLTVFLAGAECPFTCVFCDLWRHTLPGPTPPGAIPAQLKQVLAAHPGLPPESAIKLYNASNFFDDRAVPPEDDPRLLELVAPFSRITVECHPRLVGERCRRWARALEGRLEVAMGLETIHPEASARLGKGMTLEDFARAAERVREVGGSVRAFVLVGAPWVPTEETVDWTVRACSWALGHGAGSVALIPVRGGNGALERLAGEGLFTPPTLTQLEEALDCCLSLAGGVVVADLWDLERLSSCLDCFSLRRERLERLNLSGRREPRVACLACGAG